VDDLLLPSNVRLLHIGPHKTGSTAIQVALFAVRDELPAFGVWVPSGRRRRFAASTERFAAKPTFEAPLPLWGALVDEVAEAGEVRVCVSDELFGKARARVAAKIVGDLGGGRGHVLAVARRYDAHLPSQWQEPVKAGRTETYDEWLRLVLGSEPHKERSNVWVAHDTPALVRRWTRLVGAEHFTLVVADETDHGQLPRLFEQMLGLLPGLLVPDPHRSSYALAPHDVELTRRADVSLIEHGVPPRRYRVVLGHRARELAAARAPLPGPHRVPLPGWAIERVETLSRSRALAVDRLSVRVVGDAAQLAEGDPPADAEPTPEVPAELAGEVVEHVLGMLAE
jgi:hypothetical protein